MIEPPWTQVSTEEINHISLPTSSLLFVPSLLLIVREKKTMTTNSSVILLLLLLSTMIVTATLLQQVTGEISITSQQQRQQMDPNLHKQQDSRKDVYRSWFGRRWMIGSTAPSCTYNECRGCRFKCRAEQIPVDANDPINSAYHYRCVCHG